MNIAYNVKNNNEKVFFQWNKIHQKITFLAFDTETGNSKNHVQNISYHYMVANKVDAARYIYYEGDGLFVIFVNILRNY